MVQHIPSRKPNYDNPQLLDIVIFDCIPISFRYILFSPSNKINCNQITAYGVRGSTSSSSDGTIYDDLSLLALIYPMDS